MIHVVLVSATLFEIEPTLNFLKQFKSDKITVTPCITGVGMVNTAFELGKLASCKFDLAINAGIAGSFGKHSIGEVVSVSKDCFSELGAEDGDNFLSLDDLGFGKQRMNITNTFQNHFTKNIPQASGITVNKVHGNTQSISDVLKMIEVDIESMEGGAFIHAANSFSWKAIQLRAISNKVEKRNRDAWNIPLAIKNLNTTLIELINSLHEH